MSFNREMKISRKRSPVRRIMRDRHSAPTTATSPADLGDRLLLSSSSSACSTPKTTAFRDRVNHYEHHHDQEHNKRKKSKNSLNTDIYGNEYVSITPPTTVIKRDKNEPNLYDNLQGSNDLVLTQQSTTCESIFEKYCTALGLQHDLEINYKTEKSLQLIQYSVEYYSGSFFWESVQGDFLSQDTLSREIAFMKALQQISTKFWVELKHIFGTEFVPTHNLNSKISSTVPSSSSFCETQQNTINTETTPGISSSSTDNNNVILNIWPPLPKDPPPPPPVLPQNCSTKTTDNINNRFLPGNSINPWFYNYNANLHYPFIPPLPPGPPPPPPPPPLPLEKYPKPNEQEEKSNTDPNQSDSVLDNISVAQPCNVDNLKTNTTTTTSTTTPTTTTTTLTVQPRNEDEPTKERISCKKVEDNEQGRQDKKGYSEEGEEYYGEIEEDYESEDEGDDDETFTFGMSWANSIYNSSPKIQTSPISQTSLRNQPSLYESLSNSRYLPATCQIKAPIATDFRQIRFNSTQNVPHNYYNNNYFTMSGTTNFTSNTSYNTFNSSNSSTDTKIEYSAKPVLYKKQQ